MSDTVCTQSTDSIYGIESATSWPTGMNNLGPEGDAIHYDPTQITVSEVTESLSTKIHQYQESTVTLESPQVPTEDPSRDRIDTDPQCESRPLVHATVPYTDSEMTNNPTQQPNTNGRVTIQARS